MNNFIQKIYTKKNIKLIAISFVIISLILIGLRLKISGGIAGGDSIRYYSELKSLAIDHSFDVRNSLEYFQQQKSKFTGLSKFPDQIITDPQTGRVSGMYGLGTAFSQYPFFIYGHIAAKIATYFGADVSILSGFSMYHYYAVSLSALVFCLIAFWFIFKYLVDIEKKDWRLVLLSCLCLGLASPLTYYIYFVPTYSHAASFLWTSLFIIYFLFRYKKDNFNKIDYATLGFFLALTALTRYQDIVVAIIPLYLFFYDRIKFNKKIPIKGILVTLTTFLLFFSSQFFINNYLYGSCLTNGYHGQSMIYWHNPKIFYVLFSFNKGLFIWTPIILFCFIGLVKGIKDKINQSFLLFFLIELYLVSAWFAYNQAESFGIRMLISVMLVFVFGCYNFLLYLKSKKSWLPEVVSFLFIIINWVTMVLYALRIIGEAYGTKF